MDLVMYILSTTPFVKFVISYVLLFTVRCMGHGRTMVVRSSKYDWREFKDHVVCSLQINNIYYQDCI